MKYFFSLFSFVFLLQTTAQEVMTPELLWKLGRVSLNDISQDEKTMLYSVRNYVVEDNSGSSSLYRMNISKGEATLLETYISNAQFLRNGKTIAGVVDGQFALADFNGTGLKSITNIKNAENWKAIELNDGKIMLLFTLPYKYKSSVEDKYSHLPKAQVKIYDDLMYRHWNYWNDEYVNHLCFAIYNPSSGEIVSTYYDIMGDEPFDVPNPPMGGSEEYTASPDGKYIVYSCKKKAGKNFAVSTNSDLYLFEVGTGKTRNLTEGMMGYDNKPAFSPNSQKIAWLSMPTDGFESDVNQLWSYDFSTGEKSMICKEEYVEEFMWVNDQMLTYLVSKAATQQIGILDLKAKDKTTAQRLVTSGDFDYGHMIMRGKTLVAQRQDMNHATEIYQIDPAKGTLRQLTTVNDQYYKRLKKSRIEKRMIKTTDGIDMLTWVIYPPDFDPSKKYPTLLYCQGGPQSAVSQFYSFRWNFQLMAAKGYIIVAPNRRGVPGFGKEWNEQISKDWGGQAMKDYLSAIDAMAQEPYVDEKNLGAVGASYGGYSVYMLAGIHEGRFKALVSHCGLFNLESWYGTTEELFFANWDVGGPYWEPGYFDAYLKHSPHKYVQNWSAPILVIHGGKDFRVPESQGMEAFQAAQLMGVPSKFLYFPEEGHWVLGAQNGVIWHTEYFEWLDKWLKN